MCKGAKRALQGLGSHKPCTGTVFSRLADSAERPMTGTPVNASSAQPPVHPRSLGALTTPATCHLRMYLFIKSPHES